MFQLGTETCLKQMLKMFQMNAETLLSLLLTDYD